MSTASELFAVYGVDVMRSMAALLNVSSTTFFRAASLLHYYVSENGAKIQPRDYQQDGIIFLAGAALFAVAKVDGPRLSMTTMAQVVHTVRQRRAMPRAAASVALLEPPPQKVEEIRSTIAHCEWVLLEAAGFTTTCEVPHAFAILTVRALSRTDASRVPTDHSALEAFEAQENLWLNTVLALCSDSARSRLLTTEIEAPVVAAAAVKIASETALRAPSAAEASGAASSETALPDGWHRVVVGNENDEAYRTAVEELRRVLTAANPVQLLEELARPKPVSPVMKPVTPAPVAPHVAPVPLHGGQFGPGAPPHYMMRPGFPGGGYASAGMAIGHGGVPMGPPPLVMGPHGVLVPASPAPPPLQLKELRTVRPRERSRDKKEKSGKRSRSKSARKKSKEGKKDKKDKEGKKEKKDKEDKKEKKDK